MWVIIKLVLGAMEAFEFIITTFIGIDSSVDDYVAYAKEHAFLSTLVQTFKAVLAVAIVLLLIFTIYAIIKQEFDYATTGMGAGKTKDNNKSEILKGIFTKLMTMLLLPISMIFVLYGMSSVLSSFSRALAGNSENSTVAMNLLMSANYDSNRYRQYANSGKRIPIIIKHYDVSKYEMYDDNTVLANKIKSYSIQQELISTNLLINSENHQKDFQDAVLIENEKLVQNPAYGDDYESFVCTAEQYQIMADFIDYCTKTTQTYYIKAVNDPDVQWKYVDDTIYNSNNNSLTIRYRNLSEIGDGETYTIVYQTSYDITSPISDALDSIQAMLGLSDEYADNLYYEMERETGSTNIVQWANEKALIKLSEGFKKADPTTWTVSDQIIMFEYNHYSSNNTLLAVGDQAYTLDDLKSTGIELEALEIVYQESIVVNGVNTGALTSEKTLHCVLINGTYYLVEKSDLTDENGELVYNKVETDSQGNVYYILKNTDVSVNNNNKYLSNDVVQIEKVTDKKTRLKTSADFNINNSSSWSFTDQILIYEYFSDLTYKNDLSKYSFDNFKDGVDIDSTYQITEKRFSYTFDESNNKYVQSLGDKDGGNKGCFVLLNGKYYQVEDGTGALAGVYVLKGETDADKDLLMSSDGNGMLYYKFEITINESNTGIDPLPTVAFSTSSGINDANFILLDDAVETITDETLKARIGNYSTFNFKMSSGFKYNNYSTWTYRDYYLFYLYLKYSGKYLSTNLDSLKVSGLLGEVGFFKSSDTANYGFDSGTDIYIKLKNKTDVDGDHLYIKVDDLKKISEKNINVTIDVNDAIEANNLSVAGSSGAWLLSSEFFDSTALRSDTDFATLEFSDSFKSNPDNISGWTVSDFLLSVFIEQGIIGGDGSDQQSVIEDIENNGYMVLVYKLYEPNEEYISETSKISGTPYYLYKFGQSYKAGEETKTVFLDSRKVLNFGEENDYKATLSSTTAKLQYSSMNEFFNASAISFLCKYYDVSINDIIVDQTSLTDSIYQEYSNYIYSYEDIFRMMIKNESGFDIYKNLAKYEYKRPDFNANDLSTWTALDALLYYIDSSMISTSYSFNVLKTDSASYLIVDDSDYLIKLDGDSEDEIAKIGSVAGSQPTGIIYSGNQIGITGNDIYMLLENNSLSNLIYENLDESSLYLYTNIQYSYVPGSTYKPETSAVDDYAYWTNTANSYKLFDLVLRRYGVKFSVGDTKNFDIYADSSNNYYIRIKDGVYFSISTDKKKSIYFSTTNGTLAYNPNKIFVANGTFNYLGGAGSNTYKTLDALIFGITDSTETAVYTIYKSEKLNHEYVVVESNDRYYYLQCEGIYSADSDSLQPYQSNQTYRSHMEKLADLLYDEYCKDLYSSLQPEVFVGESRDGYYTYQLNIFDSSNWTPISLVMFKNGTLGSLSDYVDGSGNVLTGQVVYGTIWTGESGNEYFKLNGYRNDGSNFTYYIDVTDAQIDSATSSTDNGMRYKIYDADNDKMKILLFSHIYNVEITDFVDTTTGSSSKIATNIVLANPTDSTKEYEIQLKSRYSLKTSISDKYSGKFKTFDDDDYTAISSSAETATMSNASVDSWNWFDIAYYVLNGEHRAQDNKKFKLVLSNGDGYLKVSNSDGNYYYVNYYIGENPSKLTTDKNNLSVTHGSGDFDLSSDIYDPFVVLCNKSFNFNAGTKVNLSYFELNSTIYYFLDDTIIKEFTASSLQTTETENEYVYQMSNATNLLDLPFFEYILKYIYNGSISSFSSKIKTILGKDYLEYEEVMISLKALEKVVKKEEKTDVNTRVTTYKIVSVNNETLKTIIDYDSTARVVGSKADGSGLNATQLAIKNNPSLVYNSRFSSFTTDITNADSRNSEVYYSDNVEGGTEEIKVTEDIKFSQNFDYSDTTTWKISDLVLMYLFENGDLKPYGYGEGKKTFQELINAGGIKVDIKNVVVTVLDKGEIVKAILLKDSDDKFIYCIRYDRLRTLQDRKVVFYESSYINNNNKIEISIQLQSFKATDASGAETQCSQTDSTNTVFYYQEPYEIKSFDFTYENYYSYYYKTSALTKLKVASSELSGLNKVTFNLKLSDGFVVNNPDTWTVLDFIILYEYSRSTDDYALNYFRKHTFEDLKNDNFVVDGYSGVDKYILSINGNNYDLSGYVEADASGYIVGKDVKAKDLKDSANASIGISTSSASNKSLLKFHYSTENFLLNESLEYSHVYRLATSDQTLKYETYVDSKTIFNYRDVGDTAKLQKVDTSKFAVYTISKLVKKVSWPQKLMNDMQVIYSDLNWEVLFATDSWFDTLGDFSSAYASGQYNQSGNSANISAAGLVLSEFFLTNAKESEMGFANFEYEPIFDEKTIQSLMLSILGENDYTSLKQQADVYNNLFNTCFASIMDDIAYENGLDIVEGKVGNLKMAVYKSYLTTLLMSSDVGEYLYTVASRIFGQYSINEWLATSGGDYTNYYAYINGDLDENGDQVTAFEYGSFADLVKYENTLCNGNVPTYTFSISNAYKKMYGDSDYFVNNILDLNSNAKKFLENLVENGKSRKFACYNDKEIIINKDSGDQIKIDNPEISLESFISAYFSEYKNLFKSIGDSSDYYCYMFQAYYYQKDQASFFNSTESAYLDNLKSYILGDFDRWEVIKGVSTDNTMHEISNYYIYNISLSLKKLSLKLKADAWQISTYNDVIKSSFEGEYKQWCESYLSDSALKTLRNYINESDDKDKCKSSWDNILEYKERIGALTEKFAEVVSLEIGERSDGLYKNPDVIDIYSGISGLGDYYSSETKASLISNYYNTTLKQLQKLNSLLSEYVTTQEKVDKIQKASITFALGEFGTNYISEGYSFAIDNRTYTLSSDSSPLRIAEYVMGGAFLDQYGITPTYTEKTYTGLIEKTVAYDQKTGTIKASLNSWNLLRQFASGIAEYSSKLYYMTNFNDLSVGKSDSIKLTDSIAEGVIDGYENYTAEGNGVKNQNVTLEYVILMYLLTDENINIKGSTFARLLFADSCVSDSDGTVTGGNLAGLGSTDNPVTIPDGVKSLGNWISNRETATESQIKTWLISYINFVASTDYTSPGNYHEGASSTSSSRIHQMFVKVFTYLLRNEEDEENEDAKELSINSNWTMKDFRNTLIDFIVDYKKNPSETDEENIARYLTIFYLLSCQFNYSYIVSDGLNNNYVNIGRTIASVYIDRPTTDSSTNLRYKLKDSNGSYDYYELSGTFSISQITENTIIELSGVPNRPIEELVGLEYDELYNRYGEYDEAMGDNFVVCHYDELNGCYVPYMITGYENGVSYSKDKFDNYQNDYGKSRIYSDYSADDGYAYPIIARGILNESGLPTAIKISDGQTIFYRTNIGSVESLSDDAVEFSKSTPQVSSVKYSNYISSSEFSSVGSTGNKNAMFMSQSSALYFFNSGTSVYYIQYEKAYSAKSFDELGAIYPIEDYATFYIPFTLSSISGFMLLFGLITLLPLLMEATATVMRRVLDLIVLTLAGPLVISTTALNYDGKPTKGYTTWLQYMMQTVLAVFGYVVGFNIYFILVDVIKNMTFVSATTIATIHGVLGMNWLTKSWVRTLFNFIIKFLFYMVATTMIKVSGDTIVSVITAGKVTSAFNPAMAGKEGQKGGVFGAATGVLKNTVNDIKKKFDKIDKVITGQAALDAVALAKESLPGAKILQVGKEAGARMGDSMRAKAMVKALKANGVPVAVAKRASKKLQQNARARRENLRARQVQRANKMSSALGMGNITMDYASDVFKPIDQQTEAIEAKKKKKGKKGKDDKDKGKEANKKKAPKNDKAKKGEGKKKNKK